MEEGLSYRQVGREPTGRIIRGRASKRKSSESTPAFGSQTKRFHIESQPSALSNPSKVSPVPTNRVLGCMDKSQRFKPRQYSTITPGPGTYSWKPGQPGTVIRSVFKSKDGRSLSPVRSSPGPGQYDPKRVGTDRVVASVFRSNVKRIEGVPSPVGPAPWHYTPNFAPVQKSNSALTSTFKASVSTRRFQVNVYDPHSKPVEDVSPGPGSYEISRELNASWMPSAVFASQDTRFTTNGDQKPDPGTYDVTPKLLEKEAASGAVFKSDTQRLRGIDDLKRPGPAFYKPTLLPKKQSFLLNLKKKWVG